MDEIKAKQQVVEKIKEADKILVTVSDSPSVDALSAALGLALLLDKQEKYATTIFSGETPPAIAFLEPEKTFDDTTDSLRDFIIALNKEKADHLRYKVEGDSVKIFITPYKTNISQDDLEFSQGDYNVELIIALGVSDQHHLDKALETHGQILHDATVITMTAGDQSSDLGGIDWHDANSSSLSEMVTGLAEAMKDDKKKSLLDGPIATALLTGIVAETDRFSNENTSSKVMTVAASLMAAGADQQLIATELQKSQAIVATSPADDDDDNDDSADSHGTSSDDGEGVMAIRKDVLEVEHNEAETLAQLDQRVLGEEKAREKADDEIEAIEEEAEQEAEKRERAAIAESKPIVERPFEEVVQPAPEAFQPVFEQPQYATPVFAEPQLEFEETEPRRRNTVSTEQPQNAVHPTYAADVQTDVEPTFGGTLNATTDQAEEDARREAEKDQNRTILSHSYIGEATSAPGANGDPLGFPGTPPVAPGSLGVNDVDSNGVHPTYAFGNEAGGQALSGLGGERVIEPLPEPSVPTAAPGGLGLPLPPPLPDFSQGIAPPPVFPAPSVPQSPILGDILNSDQDQAVVGSFDTANAVPAPGSAYDFQPPEALAPEIKTDLETAPPPPPPSAPGQFQIPTQQ